MAKYIGSPWGEIRGKLNGSVGGIWKGIAWLRVLAYPTQRGTLAKYRLYKDGLIPTFSFLQMNIRRLSLQVLGYLGRMNMSNFIVPIWNELAVKRGWTMSGINAFVHRNCATLFHSMTHIDEEYEVGVNEPDLKTLLVADGDLEPTQSITSAVYVPGTGDLLVKWDPNIYTNGLATDHLFWVVLKKPILDSVGRDGNWYPALFMYGTGIATVSHRSDGVAGHHITLPIGLTAADLTVFVFFRDTLEVIGFSSSKSLQVTV